MSNSAPTDEEYREQNARLCLALRALSELSLLQSLLSSTATQLSVADRADHHDSQLCDEALSQITQRLEQSALVVAHAHLQHDLRHLSDAHKAVAGKFRGKMLDETEAVLSRALSGARLRLAAFEATMDNYSLPSRPHEIRRNALACLSDYAGEALASCQRLVARFEKDITPDLGERLKNSLGELSKFTTHLNKLKERASQKMSENLDSCSAQLKAIVAAIDAVELEAGLRGGCWFDDYNHRSEPQGEVA